MSKDSERKAKRESVAVYLMNIARKMPEEDRRKVEEAVKVLRDERNVSLHKLFQRMTI